MTNITKKDLDLFFNDTFTKDGVTYSEVVAGICENINNFILETTEEKDDDMFSFVHPHQLKVSVFLNRGWRKITLESNTMLRMIGCRVGSKDNLIFVFKAHSTRDFDDGDWTPSVNCEVNLKTVESIDNVSGVLMMLLGLSNKLSVILYEIDKGLKIKLNSGEQKGEVIDRSSNPLFASW